MKKFLFTLISILSLSVILPELKAGSVNSRNTKDLVKIPFKNDKNKNLSKLTRKKLKKIVRKAGRGYRTVKPDRQSRKKSRKVQRSARRIINIF